jgi:DNA-binding NarL/FixJ family response regulator
MTNRIERHKVKVFLVDDHALVREHLTALLQAEADLEVCGEAADAPGALALIRQSKPDLVILDISLKRSNGLDLLKALKSFCPSLAVLVLSMHEETCYVERAFRAGAMGYITKAEATTDILPAIRQVLGGHGYLSARMAGQMAGKLVGIKPAIAEEVRV